MTSLQKELRRPGIQERVFSYAKASPTELVRAKLSTSEIQHRALTYIPNELLANIPQDNNGYSLFQGFQATLPETAESEHRKKHRRHVSRGRKLLQESEEKDANSSLSRLKQERDKVDHNLEMMGVRKNMCSAEIREIDTKISNLNNMRKIVLDRLESLEQDEVLVEREFMELDSKLEDAITEDDSPEDVKFEGDPVADAEASSSSAEPDDGAMSDSFMSASIYGKLPSPKTKRHKISRRKSAAIRHEHFEPGSQLKEIQAHNDLITSLDFDLPFGTMVTAAFDDTVRVWDLNLGRCIGLLEGHQASVRCLQVEDSIVVTGSMDASIRLWDLGRADYSPLESRPSTIHENEEEGEEFRTFSHSRTSYMGDCELLTLSAHVAEVTALHMQRDTLVSGSADKTLRQWDLVKGRCVQTLDVLWAAAQALALINSNPESTASSTGSKPWRTPGSRPLDDSADFVGALQCFDAALACGTADGMVRLWDLRSGQVHRSLVGHTGAVTCLQFDDSMLVTGSADRSIRVSSDPMPYFIFTSGRLLVVHEETTLISIQIWDLRTGSIIDAYAYDNPVTSMMFDTRRIAAAAGESVAKIYDRADGRHWDCGTTYSHDGEPQPSVIERVRIRDGYLIEGRKDGVVGVWSC